MTIKRCYPVLVGASVAENQLCNGESVTVPNGHKYYLKKSGTESLGASTGTAITGLTSGSDMVIDLTQKLGSSIADYVYTLEQATAGAGIAKLKEWGFFTQGYIPYNAGSLESVEARSHVMRGFNQWDEEWEVGAINHSTGENVAVNTTIRSKNYIPCIQTASYYFANFSNAGSPYVHYYDADKRFLSYSEVTRNTVFTVPSGAHYIRFNMDTGYGTTYKHDICINLSSDRNGEYEPYKSTSYDLGSDVLRGIFKLDANNKLYADGDRKTSDGTVTRRYGVVTLNGSESGWGMSGYTSNNTYILQVSDVAINVNVNTISNAIASDMPAISFADGYNNNNIFGVAVGNSAHELRVNIPISIVNRDISAFKTWLASNPLTVVYEKTEPTTEQSTPFTNPQICYPDGTEEFVTENGVPVGHETKYQL